MDFGCLGSEYARVYNNEKSLVLERATLIFEMELFSIGIPFKTT